MNFIIKGGFPVHKNILKKSIAAISALLITVSPYVANLNISAEPLNMISNSTFDTGTSGWSTYKESGGKVSLSTDNGRLAVNITSVGTLNYAVQACYDIIPLYQNGVYRLRYEISSTVDREVEAMIQQNGGTYQAYTWKGLNLTQEPQSIDYTFTMEAETDIMSKMVFNCGTYGEELGEHTIYIDNVYLELIDDSAVDYEAFLPYEPSIMTNQVGYKPESKKIAVFRDVTTETEFSVINADTEEVVYTGELYGETSNTSADETDFFGDFSEITTPGKYYIKCGSLDDSYAFEIADNVYNDVLKDSVRMMYLQRCGTDISDSIFKHKACHAELATVYGTNEKIDVSGGWHDAGDYGRYVVPAAMTIAGMLYGYEASPQLYSDDTNIAESGNGVADILDEVRYKLEWMHKMQSESGGVYHKVSCANFPGYIMPEFETNELIVTPVSTNATADFCASMALGYEFYKDIDSEFAERCLADAEKAWAFLEANPNKIFVNPEDVTTGEYGDSSDLDERYWAAAQMYRATKDSKYLEKLNQMSLCTGLDWTTVGDYGNIALLTMKDIDTESDLYKKVKNSVVNRSNVFLKTTNNSEYGVGISKFNWGSNMTVANAGVMLGMAYKLTGEQEYLDAAESNLNYLLGKNPNGVCYVSGYGTVSPQNPHHRPSMALKQPMKGMLAGGVNSNKEDSAAKAYLASYPPAKCYVDHSESYSTNEITTYWNSSLIQLMSLIEVESATEIQKGDVNLDGIVDVKDILLLKQYILGMTSVEKIEFADMNDNGDINAIDCSLLKNIVIA